MKYLWIFASFFVLGECRKSIPEEWVVSTNCATDAEVKLDVDTYLDTVLEKARKELPDPMRLPPKSTVVDLKDGVLWGMSELRRVGDAEVICEGSVTTIKTKLTVDELKGRYTWIQERKKKDPRQGYVVFISDDFEADVELTIEKKDGQTTHPELKKFIIKKFKKAKIEITGMSYLTWAIGELTTLMSGIFQRAIASVVQNPIREALERQMKEVDLN